VSSRRGRESSRPLPPENGGRSQSSRGLTLLSLILTLMLAWQVWHAWPPLSRVPASLAPGRVLSAEFSFGEASCWVGFFVDPACAASRDLFRGAHGSDELHWIVGGERAAVDSLLLGATIDSARLRITFVEPGESHPFFRIGVRALPTRIIANGSTVLQVETTGKPLTSDSVASLCAGMQK